MTLTDTFLSKIEAYCLDHSMTEREFGLKVFGNHKFVARLRSGKGFHSSSQERAVAFMETGELPQRAVTRSRSQQPSASAAA